MRNMGLISRSAKIVASACLMAFFLAVPLSHALIEVDITKFNVEPLPVAISQFEGSSELEGRGESMAEMGRNIASVISDDLHRSGLFRPLPRNAFI